MNEFSVEVLSSSNTTGATITALKFTSFQNNMAQVAGTFLSNRKFESGWLGDIHIVAPNEYGFKWELTMQDVTAKLIDWNQDNYFYVFVASADGISTRRINETNSSRESM